MLMTIFTILFVIVCIALCVVILLQAAKGGGLGAGLGGGTATTQVFGGRGPGGFLARATVILAGTFMVLSLVLAHLSSQPQTVFSGLEEEETGGLDEDEIIESGSLKVNPDGSPLGSAPAADSEPTTNTPDTPKSPTETTPPVIKLDSKPPVVTPPATPPTGDAKPATENGAANDGGAAAKPLAAVAREHRAVEARRDDALSAAPGEKKSSPRGSFFCASRSVVCAVAQPPRWG